MAEIGILRILVIVFFAGKLGFDWQPERKTVEFALYSFLASIGCGGLVALSPGHSAGFLFVNFVGQAAGCFFLVRAAFGITGESRRPKR